MDISVRQQIEVPGKPAVIRIYRAVEEDLMDQLQRAFPGRYMAVLYHIGGISYIFVD